MSKQGQEETLFVGARAALVAGVVVGGVVVGTQLALGALYSARETRELVAAMASPVSTLATAIISGLTTILALMLTMLSLSHSLQQRLSDAFYTRIRRIALLSIVDMIVSIVLLLLLSSPIQEASQQAQQGGGTLAVTLTYYALIGLTALVAGVFVTIIVMLYNAVTTVIQAVRPSAGDAAD